MVHGFRAGRDNGIQEVGHTPRNQRRAARGKVSKRRYALPDDKPKRMAKVPLRAVVAEYIVGLLFLVLILLSFAIGGSLDWESEQAYQQAWAEANGVKGE